MKNIALAALSIAAFALPGLAADLSGSWILSGDVEGNPINMKCSFTTQGEKFSGACASDELGSTPTTGSVAGDKVTFEHSVERGQVYHLVYSGTLDSAANSIAGTIAVDQYAGTFTLKKDAAAKPAMAAAAAPDVAGNWTITGDVVGNAINMKCALKREETKISGTCNYQGLGDSPTTGSVAGDKVTLYNHVEREQPYDLTYNGTLDAASDSMKGDIEVAGVSGTFSGTKDK